MLEPEKTVNVSFVPMLRGMVRALIDTARADEPEEIRERDTDRLLPFASVDVTGKIKIDPSAPPLATALPQGDSEHAKCARADLIERRREPGGDLTAAKAAIKALPPMPKYPTDLQRCARAVEETRIWSNTGGVRVEDPNGD